MNNSFLALRQNIQENEKKILAPFACHSSESKGREYVESPDEQRTCFQRDRDRVIHCTAYRRLKGKTQVFVAHHGDHFRNRLTHSMEVAQLSRDFSRNLRINEDLSETIALSHDLGHTPFGHAGQDAMQEILHEYDLFFEHNNQSRRIVEKLEKKSPQYQGLNLTFEVRDGLVKHRNSDYKNSPNITKNGTLEAQIVDISDQIAYQNHDIDDGLRAGIITFEELDTVELWKQAIAETYAYQPEKAWTQQVVSSLIKIMSRDLLMETARRIRNLNPKKSADIRNADCRLATFSPEMEKKNNALRHFLYSKLYTQSRVVEQSEQGKQTIKRIFYGLEQRPELLPDEFFAMITRGEKKEIAIKDFIAGMTDKFALDFAENL